jgi:hypothetical protein
LGSFPTNPPAYSPSPNRITILLSYKRRCWGLISHLDIRTVKLCPFHIPSLPKYCSPFVRIASAFPISPFFLHQNPFTSQEEIRRLRGEAIQRCTWSLVKRSPDQVRGAVADFDCKGIIIELLIKELLFLSQIMVY